MSRPALAIGFGAFAMLGGCQANHSASYDRAAPPTIEDEIRTFLQGHSIHGNQIARQARFHLGVADLDGDGGDEGLVWLDDRDFCGTGGCNLLVLRRQGGSWQEVTRLTVTWPPVKILESRTNGWQDLSVYVRGGGIVRGYDAVLSFDGRTYPTNPSTPPAREGVGAVRGQVVISGGHPLPLYPEG